MRFLAALPYYGTHRNIEKLFTSLGVPYPGDEAIAKPESIFPFEFGDIYLRNNNFENIGYTAACNMGIRYGMEHGYDAIWLLTDDIEVVDVKAAVAAFQKELTEHPKTGVIGNKICFKENPDFIYHGGTLQSFPNGLHKWGSVKNGDYENRTLERWVPGGSVVINPKCVRDIGVMDEHFFSIGSDSDYCFRARMAGYDVVYLPVTVLHPSVSMTSSPTPAQQERLSKDVQYFADKWVTGELFQRLEHETFSDEVR
jgi:GT2 family glycosyltransferase